MTTPQTEVCAGYLREPHNAPPTLYLQLPDGTRKGLCRICATRWLLSDEEFGPPLSKTENKTWPEDTQPEDKTPADEDGY